MKTETAQSEKLQMQPARGTYDIMPGDSQRWQELEALLRGVIQASGYREIRTPIFEHTELFKRGVGETTDIVNKEMYTFLDKSDRSLTLRPEGTAGVVRAFMTHGLSRQPQPVKLWYQGPMFRYERTQTGRQRQFHQTGIEAFGSGGPAIDAEVIAVAADCLRKVGVASFDLQINSIGCKVCRPAYREALKEALRARLPELCEDCQDRFERNPLRMLDCKNEACQKHYKDVPVSIDHLCEDCAPHFCQLKELLSAVDIAFTVNPRLVRGLDYYSRTVFEFISDDSRLGVQSTICAGGRYDYLVETFGGPPTPAVGWAMGMERIRLLLGEGSLKAPLAFVIGSNPQAALKLAMSVRRAGISCELDFPPSGGAMRGFKRQIEQANKAGAQWALIQMEDELASGEISVKNMKEGTQERLPVEKLIGFLQDKAGNGV